MMISQFYTSPKPFDSRETFSKEELRLMSTCKLGFLHTNRLFWQLRQFIIILFPLKFHSVGAIAIESTIGPFFCKGHPRSPHPEVQPELNIIWG